MNENKNPLASFENEKARVLEFARELKAIAVDRRDEDSAAALNTLVQRFESNRFLVVAIGEFKRGKSTMINGLVGRTVCPMRVTPHTARVTRVLASKDEREFVEVHFHEEREPEHLDLGPKTLEDLVAMSGKRLEEVESVDVFVKPDGGIVQSGLVLVDTPGLQSLYEEHDRITKDFLPRADLVVFALSAMQPLGARERDFLLSHRDVLGKSIFVLNHMDQVPEGEREETIRFVERNLRDAVLGSKASEIPLFPISALRAVESYRDGKPELLTDSGIPRLAARIVEILGAERGRPILNVIAEGEKRVAHALASQFKAAREAHAARLGPDFRTKAKALQSVLRDRSTALEREVVSEIEGDASDLAAAVPLTVAQGREALKARARELIASYPDETLCKQRLPADLAKHVQTWLDESERSMRRRFKKITDSANRKCEDGFKALEREAASALEQGNAVLGLAGITSGLEALADLSAIANCLGGPIGGHGLASAVVEIAFEVPQAVKALTVGAGVVSVLAVFSGPVGWTTALLGWIAVGIANLVRSNTWRARVTREVEGAIDREIGPRAETALATAIWGFGRSLQEHLSTHVRRVHAKLGGVVTSLMNRLEADAAAVKKTVDGLRAAEDRLLAIENEVTKFIAALPAPAPPTEAAAQDAQPVEASS